MVKYLSAVKIRSPVTCGPLKRSIKSVEILSAETLNDPSAYQILSLSFLPLLPTTKIAKF